MKAPKLTLEALVQHITERYLRDGVDSTIGELAVRLGVSESTVRKLIEDRHGFCPSALVSYQDNARKPIARLPHDDERLSPRAALRAVAHAPRRDRARSASADH